MEGIKPASQNIQVYLRARPVPAPSDQVQVLEDENKIELTLPKDAATGAVNNQQERFVFRFAGVLPPSSTQDQVFDTVAKDAVLSALDGINGTCFAYGATGSGKTFTITGGVSRYADRGLIPRACSLTFATMAERPDCTFEVYVSYLEIYNDAGFDLLDPSRNAARLEDLPRVTVYEDEAGATRLRNLALHPAASEEAALNLLFLGDSNRAISETPMNLVSSRSHAIFTLHIAARQVGRDTVLRSKLHLVDLAGSERIKRSGMEGGALLREAKHINLSLHFLEQVIVALQEKVTSGRTHVPYRNSMMTLVLRDSLGGNCRTSMVATIAPSADQLLESVSTCRFAQRVAMIANEVSVNEEEDPLLVVARLRREVADLKAELRLACCDSIDEASDTPQDAARKLAALQASVDAYFDDPDPLAELVVEPPRLTLFRAAFGRLKALAKWGGRSHGATSSGSNLQDAGSGNEVSRLREQLSQLQEQVQQRDAEIAILVGMRPAAAVSSEGADAEASPTSPIKKRMQEGTYGRVTGNSSAGGSPSTLAASTGSPQPQLQATAAATVPPPHHTASHANGHPTLAAPASVPAHSQLRMSDAGDNQGGDIRLQQAFEAFRRTYAGEASLQADKATLAASYAEAKALAKQVNECKQRIDELKAGVERERMQQALPKLGVLAMASADVAIAEPDAAEKAARHNIDQEKAAYRSMYTLLTKKKAEIEQLQASVQQARRRVQEDFQQWLQDNEFKADSHAAAIGKARSD